MFGLDTKYTVVAGVVIVLIVVIGLMYYSSPKSKTPTRKSEGYTAPPQQAQPLAELVLFHANWCHHCKDLMPVWQQAKSSLAGKVATKELEQGEAGSLPQKYGIQGFPTILLFPSGLSGSIPPVQYPGPRDVHSIVAFALSGGREGFSLPPPQPTPTGLPPSQPVGGGPPQGWGARPPPPPPLPSSEESLPAPDSHFGEGDPQGFNAAVPGIYGKNMIRGEPGGPPSTMILPRKKAAPTSLYHTFEELGPDPPSEHRIGPVI